jgi:2-methylcitrate dehydratase PrpD
MLLLLDTAHLEAGAIEAIEVQLPTAAVARVDGNRLWSHNIQYVLALTALERHVDLAHFTPEWTSKPEITRLAATVTVRASDDLQARFPEQKGAIVTVSARGETFTRRVDAPRGSPHEPLSRDELDEKFLRLASQVIGADGASRLSARLAGIGLDESPGPIFAALRPDA